MFARVAPLCQVCFFLQGRSALCFLCSSFLCLPPFYIPLHHPDFYHLKSGYSKHIGLKQISCCLRLRSAADATWNPSANIPLCTRIKVTAFSKGCLIRQRAVFTGPGGCCQACLCTNASAREIYPVCFGTVATCFSLSEQICPFTPSKEKQRFHWERGGKKKKEVLRQVHILLPGKIFHLHTQHITHSALLHLRHFEGLFTPSFM